MIDKYLKISAVFKALGHPTRLRIVEGLLKDGCNVTHMVECLNVPQATISQHLNVLKVCGVIKGERKGSQICYKIANPKIENLFKCMF